MRRGSTRRKADNLVVRILEFVCRIRHIVGHHRATARSATATPPKLPSAASTTKPATARTAASSPAV
jgi:hypothetical protein